MATGTYVVVADNDQYHKMPNTESPYYDNKGPLVFETYVYDASIENAKKFIAGLGGRYGKCRIAKLNFIEINEEI